MSRLLVLGDSISNGNYFDGQEWHILEKNRYCDIVAERLQINDYVHVAVSGSSIAQGSSLYPEEATSLKINEENRSNFNYVIIAGGTNDYGNEPGIPLGESNSTNQREFYGGVDYLFKEVKRKNPKANVFVILPLRREGEDNLNSYGYCLDDYRNVLVSKSKEYGFYLIDGRDLPFDLRKIDDKNKYGFDGLHPNDKAHLLYGAFVFEEITKLINKN